MTIKESDPDADRPCSCDESLALKAAVLELQNQLMAMAEAKATAEAGRNHWHESSDANLERAEKAEARVRELEGDLHASYDRGRAQGRVDVGKYSRAIGEIENCLGMAGAVPLSQTVGSVRALKERVRELEAARARCRAGEHLLIMARCEDCGISALQLHAESEARALRERIERAIAVLNDTKLCAGELADLTLEALRGS